MNAGCLREVAIASSESLTCSCNTDVKWGHNTSDSPGLWMAESVTLVGPGVVWTQSETRETSLEERRNYLKMRKEFQEKEERKEYWYYVKLIVGMEIAYALLIGY